MSNRKVLSVGQCNADHSKISQMLMDNFDVEILRAHSLDEAKRLAESGPVDLILVNRLMDADGSEGIGIIAALKSGNSTKSAVFMLVSNYDEAQQEAVKAGALPGFGKDAINDPATIERLAIVLNT